MNDNTETLRKRSKIEKLWYRLCVHSSTPMCVCVCMCGGRLVIVWLWVWMCVLFRNIYWCIQFKSHVRMHALQCCYSVHSTDNIIFGLVDTKTTATIMMTTSTTAIVQITNNNKRFFIVSPLLMCKNYVSTFNPKAKYHSTKAATIE